MVDLGKYLSQYVEKDDALVLYLDHSTLHAGLSGEARPRVSSARGRRQRGLHPSQQRQGDATLEPLLRECITRGVMVGAGERKCVAVVDWGEAQPSREALLKGLLGALKCPGVVLTDSAEAAAVVVGGTALVVVGEKAGGATIVPVAAGKAVPVAVTQWESDFEPLASCVARVVSRCPLAMRPALVANILSINITVDRAALAVALGPLASVMSLSEGQPWVGGSLIGATLKLSTPFAGNVLLREPFLQGQAKALELGEVK